MLLTTTTATMFLMVIVIFLFVRQSQAYDYYKGYEPLRNEHHPYEDHQARTPNFPRPRHGYSKPHPKPRDTPCACKKTFFVPAVELKSFQEHRISASLMGCTLATGSGEDEVRAIRQVAIDYQPENPNIPLFPFMLIGLASEPTIEEDNTDPGGPWGWIDGCTPYTNNVFLDLPPFTVDQTVWVGVIAYDSFLSDMFELGAGDIAYDAISSSDFALPAIYECCVGNKSYHPQTYVLGSPHETHKKKIVHAQSLYIP